jgi:hypothetical protein
MLPKWFRRRKRERPQQITINIHGPSADRAQIGRELVKLINEHQRRSGQRLL